MRRTAATFLAALTLGACGGEPDPERGEPRPRPADQPQFRVVSAAGEDFYIYEAASRADGERVCAAIQANTPEQLKGDSSSASDDADWVAVVLPNDKEYRCDLDGGDGLR